MAVWSKVTRPFVKQTRAPSTDDRRFEGLTKTLWPASAGGHLKSRQFPVRSGAPSADRTAPIRMRTCTVASAASHASPAARSMIAGIVE